MLPHCLQRVGLVLDVNWFDDPGQALRMIDASERIDTLVVPEGIPLLSAAEQREEALGSQSK